MKMSRLWLLAPVALMIAVSTGPAMAADPTVNEVYAAARAGQVDKAIGMMDVVLKSHPNSAKAHYVQAELLAKQQRFAEARSQLAAAEKLDPTLKGIQQQSVSALKTQLNGGAVAAKPATPAPADTGGFSWGLALVAGVAVFALLTFLRRRSQRNTYQPPMGGGYNPQVGPNGYGPNGYGPQGGFGQQGFGQQGGFGSGLMGNLAAGAAAGVGIAAGERLINGMFGGNETPHAEQPKENSAWDASSANQDMGGNDFGLSDDSWDTGGDSGGDW